MDLSSELNGNLVEGHTFCAMVPSYSLAPPHLRTRLEIPADFQYQLHEENWDMTPPVPSRAYAKLNVTPRFFKPVNRFEPPGRESIGLLYLNCIDSGKKELNPLQASFAATCVQTCYLYGCSILGDPSVMSVVSDKVYQKNAWCYPYQWVNTIIRLHRKRSGQVDDIFHETLMWGSVATLNYELISEGDVIQVIYLLDRPRPPRSPQGQDRLLGWVLDSCGVKQARNTLRYYNVLRMPSLLLGVQAQCPGLMSATHPFTGATSDNEAFVSWLRTDNHWLGRA